jgi:N-acetylneuraminic acid mutarotase
VVIYGIIPASRWGHAMAPLDNNKLVIFGGVNTNAYMNTQVHIFEIGEDAVDLFMLQAKDVIESLKIKAKSLNSK